MFKNLVSSSGHMNRMSSKRIGEPCTFSADAWPSPGALLFWAFSRKSSIDLRLSLKPRRLMMRLVDACDKTS